MAQGFCCMARHAKAVAPWTCDCPCHQSNALVAIYEIDKRDLDVLSTDDPRIPGIIDGSDITLVRPYDTHGDPGWWARVPDELAREVEEDGVAWRYSADGKFQITITEMD